MGDNLVEILHKESSSVLILLPGKTVLVVVFAEPVDVSVLGRHNALVRILWIGCGWGVHF